MLAISSKGDVLELGLRLSPRNLSAPQPQRKAQQDGAMTLIFEFLHRSLHSALEQDAASNQPPPPNLQTTTLQGLLRSLGAELRVDPTARGAHLSRKYDFVTCVKPGNQVLTAHTSPKEEEAMRQPFPDFRLAHEPTIGELLEFAGTLKGQKATFYASTKSSFAHYLTIYLTGWGMDVTHVAPDNGLSTPPLNGDQAPIVDADSAPIVTPDSLPTVDGAPKPPDDATPAVVNAPFIIIDDDINVLKTKLSDLQMPLLQTLQGSRSKRPALVPHHRPKSSSLIRRAMAQPNETMKPPFSSVIVYFTSLSRYREVKDVVQAIIMPKVGRGPEIIVIPKPAGVRRFLTALYTAVTKPMIDPVFFSPIATSPTSPSSLTMPHLFAQPVQSPRPATSPLSSSELIPNSVATPYSSGTPTPVQTIPASPITPGGYFERESKKMAGSASSGLFVKSPDGRTGIFFQPLALQSDQNGHDTGGEARTTAAESNTRQVVPNEFTATSPSSRPKPDTAETGVQDESARPPSTQTHPTQMFATHTSPPVLSATLSVSPGDANSTMGDPVFDRCPVAVKPTKPIRASIVGAKAKRQTDVVVPPISVLIVEGRKWFLVLINAEHLIDNSIQRTILSTFMKNKHIAYGIAENGQEAVERWSTGNYHLVLVCAPPRLISPLTPLQMDIQMPVMDGIEATKRIRELEGARHRALSILTPLSEGVHTPNSNTSNDSHRPSTPFHSSVIIVALTAQSSPQDRVAALAAGCNDFLSKPVKLQWLERKIIEWGTS